MPSRRESTGIYWTFRPFLGLKGTLYFVLHQGIALEKRAPFAPKTHKNDRFRPRYARADPVVEAASSRLSSRPTLRSRRPGTTVAH